MNLSRLGSLPSGGNHHTCGRDTWEGPHPHRGLFRCFVLAVFWLLRSLAQTTWLCLRGLTAARVSFYLQMRSRLTSSCFKRSPRSAHALRCRGEMLSSHKKLMSVCRSPLQANVICIVYSVNNKKSIEKVSSPVSFLPFYSRKTVSLGVSLQDILLFLFFYPMQSFFFFPAGDQPLDSPHYRKHRQGQQVWTVMKNAFETLIRYQKMIWKLCWYP